MRMKINDKNKFYSNKQGLFFLLLNIIISIFTIISLVYIKKDIFNPKISLKINLINKNSATDQIKLQIVNYVPQKSPDDFFGKIDIHSLIWNFEAKYWRKIQLLSPKIAFENIDNINIIINDLAFKYNKEEIKNKWLFIGENRDFILLESADLLQFENEKLLNFKSISNFFGNKEIVFIAVKFLYIILPFLLLININMFNFSNNKIFSVLFVFSVFLLIHMMIFKNPEIRGDGSEYLHMTQSFHNHLTPDLRLNDIQDAKKIVESNNIGYRTPPDFFKANSGALYGYHFWLYSLVNVPIKAILKLFNLNELKCFQITNAIMFLAALWFVYFFMEIQTGLKNFFLGFLIFNPVIWYIIWPHPEIFSYSFLIISLVMFSNNNLKLAMLFSSIATMQNSPILMVILFFIYKYIDENYKKINIKDSLIAILCCIPAGIPAVFYYYNFNTPNLILKIGLAGTEFITFQKIYDFIFDLNIGLITYVPIIVFFFLITIGVDIYKKKWEKLLWVIVILMIIISSSQTANWNHGCSGILRYAVWVIPILLYFIFCDFNINKKINKYILIFGLTVHLFILIFGTIEHRPDNYLYFTRISEFVMGNFPYLYSPEFEIFAERIMHREMEYKDKLPLMFSYKGNVTKILTDYNSFMLLKNYRYNIIDYDYFNKELDKLKNIGNKLVYVNLPKGIIKEF